MEGTDIDGDGAVEMVTTTTVRAEQFSFPPIPGGNARHGVRTTEVEVSELDTDRDGKPDARGVTVTEWLEADLDGDGDLDLVRVSERSALDHDGDGRADFITDSAREDVAVDTTGDGTRDTVITTLGSRVEEPTDGQASLKLVEGGRS